MREEKVLLEQDAKDSPTRFSKTFGREKTLDKLLQSADDEELLKNLARDGAGPVDGKK